jgi:hypothetical protein
MGSHSLETSFLVLATVIMIINCDRKTFMVEAKRDNIVQQLPLSMTL